MYSLNIPILFLTDYGMKDEYVGVVKSIILSINGEAKIIDISHEIPPQDIYSATFMIEKILKYLPQRSIILAVVDPTVGSKRKAIVGESEIEFEGIRKNVFFVGPDNGIFTPILLRAKHCKVFEINTEKIREETKKYGLILEKSNTFHGRDIFGPACALISKDTENVRKISFQEHGEIEPVKLELPIPKIKVKSKKEKEIIGHIIHIDIFGNLITNIPKEYIEAHEIRDVRIEIINYSKIGKIKKDTEIKKRKMAKKIKAPFVNSYDSVKKGKPLIIIGSYNTLEISVREGSAEKKFGAKKFDVVKVKLLTK